MGCSASTLENDQNKIEDDISNTRNHVSDTKTLVGNPQIGSETTMTVRTKSLNKEDSEDSDFEDYIHDDLVQRAKNCADTIKTVYNQRTSESQLPPQFKKSAFQLLRILSLAIENEDQTLLQCLTKYNIEYQTIVIYCKFCTEILKNGNNPENSGIMDTHSEPFYTMFVYLVDSSDDNANLCDLISKESKFLNLVTTKLEDWSGAHLKNTLPKSTDDTIEYMITLLHEVAMFEDNVHNIRSVGSVSALKPYLDSENNTIRLLSLVTLADIVNESESELLKSRGDVINYLMWTMSRALEKSERSWDGWSLKELARIIRQVARNDNNQRTVVKHGAVPLLIKLAGSEMMTEQTEAVAAIWTLSFDKQNRQEMLSNKEWRVVETLERISQSTDNELKNISKKALWTLTDQATVTSQRHDEQETTDNIRVMISYNWKEQSVVKQIRDNLNKHGIKVWLDVDDSHGSTLAAMAKAVEQADIVLLCYSFSYKHSANCRAEAEYAFRLKKTIIPLKMVEHYHPDGWLGLIVQGKLIYDFGGTYSFENQVQELRYGIEKTLGEIKGSDKLLHHANEKKAEKINSDYTSLAVNNKIETKSSNDEHSDLSDLEDYSHDDLVTKTKSCMKTIKSVQNQRTSEGQLSSEFRKSSMELLRILSFAIENENEKLLQCLTNFSVKYQTIIIYCKICTEILKTGNNVDNSEIIGKHSESFYNLLVYLANSSDDNSNLCDVISKQSHFLQSVTTKLKDWSGVHLNNTLAKSTDDILEYMITLLHEVAMFEDNVTNVRSAGCVDALKPYLDSENNTIRLLSLVTLADIVNESESELLKSRGDVINYLIWTISMALDKSERSWDGWSLKELARIIRQIARNDNNQRTVVKHGAVPLLIKMTASNIIKEQTEAVAAIWTLSFDKQNREEMLSNKEWNVIEALERMSQSTEVELKNISTKALWTIKDRATATVGEHEQQMTTWDSEPHIMISYNWKEQAVVKQIHDTLVSHGIKVWMDMEGCTLQDMATAVEKSDIVLLCYSFRYKNSANCRAEAEYSFRLRKTIIPLKLEQGYDPDGWLGLIVQGKLIYDFSGKYVFEDKMQQLTSGIQKTLNEIKGRKTSDAEKEQSGATKR